MEAERPQHGEEEKSAALSEEDVVVQDGNHIGDASPADPNQDVFSSIVNASVEASQDVPVEGTPTPSEQEPSTPHVDIDDGGALNEVDHALARSGQQPQPFDDSSAPSQLSPATMTMMHPPSHAPPSRRYDDIHPPDHDPPLLPPRRVPRYAPPPPARPPSVPPRPFVDDVTSAFRRVPDECVDHILSFLQAPELAKCGATCRRFRQRSSLPRLWRRLFLLDFHAFTAAHTVIIPPPPGLPSPSSNSARARPPPPPPPSFLRYHLHHHSDEQPASILSQELRTAKSSYMKRAQEVEERKQLRGETRRLQAIREARARKRRRIAHAMECFGYRVLFPLFGACALCLFGLITTAQSAPAVFVPVWILLFFVGCAIGAGTLLFHKRNDPDSLLHALWDNHIGLTSTWMNELVAPFESRRRMFAIAAGYTIYLLLLTFCVLLCYKVSTGASSSVKYVHAFIPAWVLVLLCCLVISPAPSFRESSVSEKQEFAATILLFLLPLLCFVILLPLYLDGYLVTSLEIVFIPLWFQDCLYLLFVSVHSIATGIQAGELREIKSNIGYMLVLWATAAPIVIFEALLCVYVQPGQTSVSLQGLFAPLFLFFSGFTLVFVILLCSGEDSIEDDILLMQNHPVPPPLQQPAPAVRQFQRSYGSRNLPQQQGEDLLTRASWAHATNPQFDVDAYHHMWDNLMQNFNEDAVIEGAGGGATPDVNSLSDFHRMQLAISRALQDLSNQQTGDGPRISQTAATAGGATSGAASAPAVPPRRPNDNPTTSLSRRHGVAYYRHNPPSHHASSVEEDDDEGEEEGPRTPRHPPEIQEENEDDDQLDLV